MKFTALNYYGAKPKGKSVKRVTPKDSKGHPICLKFNTVDGRRVDKDGNVTCSNPMCSKPHVMRTKWPVELQRDIHMLGGIFDRARLTQQQRKESTLLHVSHPVQTMEQRTEDRQSRHLSVQSRDVWH